MAESTAKEYLQEISGWQLVDSTKITKTFLFKDFIRAIHFVQKLAFVSERAGHHPDIHIFYNKVRLDIYTHSIQGLHENDFILAAKIDAIQ